MTVQDFIVNYSATFEYLHKRYGKAAVVALWEYLGETNTELYNMVAEGGLEGYLRYFMGIPAPAPGKTWRAARGSTRKAFIPSI